MKNKTQLYSYVGSEEILKIANFDFKGYKVSDVNDIIDWIESNSQEIINHSVTATFIISENQELFINDRHSEHVVCAGGKKVLSAGEISFMIDKNDISISEISNQSTGYCPKSESWIEVNKVLQKIGIDYPDYFTTAFEFRLCTSCRSINLIKVKPQTFFNLHTL